MNSSKAILNFVGFSVVGIGVYYLFRKREKITVDYRNVVIISGSNSGLGYNMALRCAELKMTVVACCYGIESAGARSLKELHKDTDNFFVVDLDVTRPESISRVQNFVEEFIGNNQDVVESVTLINNCAVMCFGETEWQTNSIVDQQIGVNLLGTIKFTKAFLPIIRQFRGRIINVTSHCALRALPGLPIYGASKAGLRSFNDTLRLDMKKYGVQVVNFIPGSFVHVSNIAARQQEFAQEMRENFSTEQIEFYGDYFDRFNDYLKVVSGSREPQIFADRQMMKKFECALLDKHPKAVYLNEPWRYKFYHFLFGISPQPVYDWLMYRFVSMPEYLPSRQ